MAEETTVRQEAWAEAARSITQPRAVAARYDPDAACVTIRLANGCAFSFPVSRYPELATGTPSQLAAVEVDLDGEALVWDEPNFAISVPGLIMEAIGGDDLWRHWAATWEQRVHDEMQRLRRDFARKGGQSKSPARAAASKENGKKGGRPRKEESA